MSNQYLGLIVLAVLSSTYAFAAERYYPPKTPWHLVDIWWVTADETYDFKELSIDFEIIGKLSKNHLLYIAPMGLGSLNGIKFYGGIQTNCGGWQTKKDRTITKFGKGGIFSRWSKDGDPINIDYAQGDKNTHYECAGYEGNFVSVRNKFHWDEGKYRYSVKKLRTVLEGGNTFTWFAAYVYCYNSANEYYVGSLKFEGDTFTYGKRHAAFLEIYGGTIRSEIPKIIVIFNEPKINGRKRNIKSTTINYPDNGYKSDNRLRFAYTKIDTDKVAVITTPAGLNDGVTIEKH